MSTTSMKKKPNFNVKKIPTTKVKITGCCCLSSGYRVWYGVWGSVASRSKEESSH